MGILSKIKSLLGIKKHHTYYNLENDLPEDEIEQNRDEIVALLKATRRQGLDKVLSYMRRNDFFHMPSSVHKHHNFRGGLAQHVLQVYHAIRDEYPDLPEHSVAIVAILHDICKTDLYYYKSDGGLRRNHGKSQRRGFKSVKILKDCGFELNESERLAIRWHMGGMNATSDEMNDSIRARRDPLAQALYKCNRENSLSNYY